jgi:prepilin-type N-terminal cleavage/methylation domain-containing protein
MSVKFNSSRKQAGDTIVEVMVVVAILGLAFSMAYATASSSLNKTRNAQEHAEALQYINSQVELLRNAASDSTIRTAGEYCMNPATGKPILEATDPGNFDAICNHFGLESLYEMSITYRKNINPSASPTDDVYTFTVSWPGTGGLGQQQEHLYYKVHPL